MSALTGDDDAPSNEQLKSHTSKATLITSHFKTWCFKQTSRL